jgi:hypothetical protein
MNSVDVVAGRLAEELRGALAAERRAAACDCDLAEHFEQHNLGGLASLCRRLATGHQEAIEALRMAGIDAPARAERWLDDDARDFVMRVAGPRQLLGVALANESGVAEVYDQLAAGTEEVTAARLAQRAHEAAREVSVAMESVPAAPNWDQLISSGMVPALALGAERRMRRHP